MNDVELSTVFSRLTELAIADGPVPDDGNGLDGVWQRTIEASDRDEDWHVAINGDVENDQEAEDFPVEGENPEIPPGRAVIYLGNYVPPAGVLGPLGGQCLVEQTDEGAVSVEDEFLQDVETALIEAGEDIDRPIPLEVA